jgi:hypothetical protein
LRATWHRFWLALGSEDLKADSAREMPELQYIYQYWRARARKDVGQSLTKGALCLEDLRFQAENWTWASYGRRSGLKAVLVSFFDVLAKASQVVRVLRVASGVAGRLF